LLKDRSLVLKTGFEKDLIFFRLRIGCHLARKLDVIPIHPGHERIFQKSNEIPGRVKQ